MLLRMRNISDGSCRVTENTHFMFNNFFQKIVPFYEIMLKNMVEPERPQTVSIWRIRVAGWISKATRAHAHAHSHTPGNPHAPPHTHTHTHTHTQTDRQTDRQKYVRLLSLDSKDSRTHISVLRYTYKVCLVRESYN
jgi:hypothetical protein